MVEIWRLVVCVVFIFFLLWFGLPWSILCPIVFLSAFVAPRRRNLSPWFLVRAFLRDIRYILFLATGFILPGLFHQKKHHTIVDLFRKTLARNPVKAAFIFEGKIWTFQEVEDYSNRIANYFKSCGYQKGDVIALFMESSPEFVCMWLGLAKIGVVSSLINFNLHLDSLYHCVNVCNAKGLIFGAELGDAVRNVQSKFPENFPYYCVGRGVSSVLPSTGSCHMLHDLLQNTSSSPPKQNVNKSFYDQLMYIFTSGTTGLPKPVIIRHSKFFFIGKVPTATYGVSASDIVYCTLPLYHTTGALMGVGTCFLAGATLVIRRKFSASCFWDECVKHKVTVIQYIGELCRYLLAQPVSSSEASHSVRLAIGNGLKKQIWTDFQSRFQIKQICEFYGSTEGNVGLINIDGTLGAVGYLPQFIPGVSKLVQVKPETGELVRGADGLAVECDPGHPGTLVAKIQTTGIRRFDGYLNKQDTVRKISHNVISHGDSVFLSGDVFIRDEHGYVYFHDRTGDTFRWHGENVSTTEVELVISKILGLRDVAVYGVVIPVTDGKAGMAAISTEAGEIDLDYLAEQLKKSLPSYARPVFIRFKHKLDITGTLKLQKVKLQQQGFDVNHPDNGDIFMFDRELGKYFSLDAIKYQKLITGKIKI